MANVRAVPARRFFRRVRLVEGYIAPVVQHDDDEWGCVPANRPSTAHGTLARMRKALRARSRDAGEFEQLAVPLLSSLYNLAFWLTRNAHDAEDLTQETYLKALKGFDGFEPGTQFKAWIFRILRNTFLTSRSGLVYARTLPLEDFEDRDEVSDPATPESNLLARAQQAEVREALRQIAPHLTEILVLCDVEELSYKEIASVLTIPVGTVMSRISRARQALRQQLSGVRP